MVDPKGEVYLISKDTSHQGRGMLFHVPSTAWTTPGSHSHRVNLNSTAVVIAPSHHHDPVAGDISPYGNEVLVKVTRDVIYDMAIDLKFHENLSEDKVPILAIQFSLARH